MSKNKTIRHMLIGVVIGMIVVILSFPLLFTLYVFWQPEERYATDGLIFKKACESLENKEFTFENIRTINGYCRSAAYEPCRPEDILQTLPIDDFVITHNGAAGGSEGYRCKIRVDNQQRMHVEAQFIAID